MLRNRRARAGYRGLLAVILCVALTLEGAPLTTLAAEETAVFEGVRRRSAKTGARRSPEHLRRRRQIAARRHPAVSRAVRAPARRHPAARRTARVKTRIRTYLWEERTIRTRRQRAMRISRRGTMRTPRQGAVRIRPREKTGKHLRGERAVRTYPREERTARTYLREERTIRTCRRTAIWTSL